MDTENKTLAAAAAKRPRSLVITLHVDDDRLEDEPTDYDLSVTTTFSPAFQNPAADMENSVLAHLAVVILQSIKNARLN